MYWVFVMAGILLLGVFAYHIDNLLPAGSAVACFAFAIIYRNTHE